MITTKVLLLFYAYPKCGWCISENTPLNPISSKSCHTPTKTKLRKPKKSLFPEDHIYRNTCHKRILAVLDSVLDKLQEYDYIEDFVSFFELVDKDKYPLSCIAFPCFLDTVHWYSVTNSATMIYREETRLFWRAVYRILHGKAISLFSGIKSIGGLVSGKHERGHLDTNSSDINFAVPHVSNLTRECEAPIPSVLSPGIIDGTMALKNSTQSQILSVDAKKLAIGLNELHGDEDLWGYEKPRLEDQVNRIRSELARVRDLQTDCSISKLTESIQLITERIKELRELTVKQTFHLQSMKKKAGENWRNSIYVHGISKTYASLHEIQQTISNLLQSNIDLMCYGARLQGNECSLEVDDLQNLSNYVVLPHMDQCEPIITRLVKQRSELWKNLRAAYPVTGSTMNKAIGLNGLKAQKEHMNVGRGVHQPAPISKELQEKFDHGTNNEQNAIATLAGIVLPYYYPQLHLMEEGCYEVSGVLVSPDGGLYQKQDAQEYKAFLRSESNTSKFPVAELAVEIKCPFPED